MAKYEKLGPFLSQQTLSEVPMTFAEIEGVVGHALPRSARYPAWWSNNPSNNVMTKIWLEAGFKTEQVNVEGKKLVFRRVQSSKPSTQPTHPAYGSMKELLHNAPGMADTPRAYSARKERESVTPSAMEDTSTPEAGYPPFYGSMKGLITIMPGVDLAEPADPEWGKLLNKKYGKSR